MRDEQNERDDQLLGRLVKLGGPARAGTELGAERLKRQLRPVWEGEVKRNRRNEMVRIATIATIAAAAIFAILGVFPRFEAPTDLPVPIEIGQVVGVAGDVRIESGGTIRRMFEDSQITAGTVIETSPGSSAAFSMKGGGSIRIGSDTAISFVSRNRVSIDRGRIYLDSGADEVPAIVVDAGLAEIREIGTQFEVTSGDQEVLVRVRTGKVEIEASAGKESIETGEGIRVEPERIDRLPAIPQWDPYWDWIAMATPPFDVEGRTAGDYLSWVAEETGLEIHFADAATEQAVGSTVLHGTIRDLGARDSLDVILPTVALEGEIEQGSLIVRSVNRNAGS